MGQSRLKQLLMIGAACGLFTILFVVLCGPSLERQWRNLKDGMTQQEVSRALGTPSWTGPGSAIGAGNKVVTRWGYRQGRYRYFVDFDYTGPNGTPTVYRTERVVEGWDMPAWWPWTRARARA